MKGTPPSLKDLLSSHAPFEKRFISDLTDLTTVVLGLKNAGYSVVQTQGVFDLMHKGHAKYLEIAKSYGDILVVGVDTDELTRKRKGKNRPIVPEEERLQMLMYLRSVDIVTLRTLQASEEDIDYLHKALRPDVFVMSQTTKDFPVEKRVEIEKYVGRVEVLEPQAETSSTARIRHLMIDGVSGLTERIGGAIEGYMCELRGEGS